MAAGFLPAPPNVRPQHSGLSLPDSAHTPPQVLRNHMLGPVRAAWGHGVLGHKTGLSRKDIAIAFPQH